MYHLSPTLLELAVQPAVCCKGTFPHSLSSSLSQEEELQVQMELVEKLTLQLHELEDSLEVSQQESNTLKKQVLCPLPHVLLTCPATNISL